MQSKTLNIIRNCSQVGKATRLCMIKHELLLEMEVWQSPIMVQRGLRIIKGRNATPKYMALTYFIPNWFALVQLHNRRALANQKQFAEKAKEAITGAFQRIPTKSILQYQWKSGVSYGSMQQLLKEMKLRSWKPHFGEALVCEGYNIRIESVESLLACIQEEPNLLWQILWSDKAVF